MLNSKTFLSMTTAAALVAAPMVAFGQNAAAPNEARGGAAAQAPADGTPGNPPSTATQRALDGATGNATSPDGTGNNPPGTAAGRAVDRATEGSTQGRTGTTTMGTATTGSGTSATGAATPGSTGTTSATGATTPNMSVDSASIRDGRRASRIIGSNIYNDENASIGEVDDIIFQSAGGPMVAVVSVGGFLGIGAKLVAVPYDRLTLDTERNRWVLRGATKDSLQSLPAFEYDSANRRG